MQKIDFDVNELGDTQKSEMEKHGGFNQGNIKEHYDELAVNYEQVYLTAGWPDPRKSADLAIEFVNESPAPMEEANVLDMGCGTGLVG